MKKLLTLALAVLMAFALIGCGQKEEQKERVVVVYSPNSDGEINAIIPAFEEETGIKVELVSLQTGDCLTRLQSEAANPQADVMWGGLNYGKYASYPDLWEKYVSPNEANFNVEGYKNQTGYYTNFGLSGNTAFLVNPAVCKSLGVDPASITGYQSLVDNADKLKGQIIMANPAKSSSAWQELLAMIYCFGGGHTNGWEKLDLDAAFTYVTEFIAACDGIIEDSSSQPYKKIFSGEGAVGVTYEDPAVNALIDGAKDSEGNDIILVYPEEGNNWLPCAAGLVKNAPHSEEGKAFIDFLISDKGQTQYTGSTLRPVITTYVNTDPHFLPFSEIPNVFTQDEAYIASQQDAWKARWTEILDAYNATK